MTPEELAARLQEPFAPDEVRWKPQTVKGNRALAIAYIDARLVMDRLDEVFGVGGWQTEYRETKEGVVCRLSVRAGGEWVTHEDVGGESEQPDEGDRQKAAFSDSLKRVAVHLGVGRYLYRLPHQWLDYDPQKRQFVGAPRLPAWALPGRKAAPARPEPARTPSPAPAPSPAANGNGGGNGGHASQSVLQRVEAFEAKLLAGGLCAAGECMDHVHRQLSPKYGDAMSGWPAEAADEAREACLAFRAALEAPADPADVARVAAELARTGEGWGRVCTAFGWQGKSRANLTAAEARAVLARLREHPGKAEG